MHSASGYSLEILLDEKLLQGLNCAVLCIIKASSLKNSCLLSREWCGIKMYGSCYLKANLILPASKLENKCPSGELGFVPGDLTFQTPYCLSNKTNSLYAATKLPGFLGSKIKTFLGQRMPCPSCTAVGSAPMLPKEPTVR